MTDEEKIRTVLNYKHDVGNRIIACIREPYLNLMDCVSEEYKLKRSNLFEQLEKNVAQIVNFFSQKWDNSQQKSEVVERIIRENLQALKDIIEPLIDEVLLFFEEQCLLQKKDCFRKKSDGSFDEDSLFTITMLEEVTNEKNSLKDDLKKLYESYIQVNRPVNYENCSLLVLLQSELDKIKEAEVIYIDEYSYMSNIYVTIDKERFLKHVLRNISENIQRHAFPSQLYQFVWERKVVVNIEQDEMYYIVSIKNNGAPFNGEVKNVFDQGYCHGATKHTGYGLSSARQAMRDLGGDIDFIAHKAHKTSFPVEYIIKIKR